MAKTLIMLITLSLLVVAIHFETAISLEDEEDEGEYYVLDSVLDNGGSARRSRFLTSTINKKIKKGTSCDAKTKAHVCNGVSANNGTSLLYCCKKHCRNVLGDRNNCGKCGHKCQFGERCCGGVCTNVLRNRSNCGKCNKHCPYRVKCEYGYCGYA
ncbi:Stigma-specific Stig1 family protein [Perilla frutescens var. frutescens]|nr:Stigma-specific Stig1 family protein [Perilla frutescens var. frutescens]